MGDNGWLWLLLHPVPGSWLTFSCSQPVAPGPLAIGRATNTATVVSVSNSVLDLLCKPIDSFYRYHVAKVGAFPGERKKKPLLCKCIGPLLPLRTSSRCIRLTNQWLLCVFNFRPYCSNLTSGIKEPGDVLAVHHKHQTSSDSARFCSQRLYTPIR